MVEAVQQPRVRGADEDLAGSVGRRRDRPHVLSARDARGDVGPGAAAVIRSRQCHPASRAAHVGVVHRAGVNRPRVAAVLRHAPYRRRIRECHQRLALALGVEDDDPLRRTYAEFHPRSSPLGGPQRFADSRPVHNAAERAKAIARDAYQSYCARAAKASISRRSLFHFGFNHSRRIEICSRPDAASSCGATFFGLESKRTRRTSIVAPWSATLIPAVSTDTTEPAGLWLSRFSR